MTRPACAVAIAATLSEWAAVDWHLASLLSWTLGGVSADGNGASPSWAAVLAMEHIEALQRRLHLVNRALIDYLPNELFVEWETIVKRLPRLGARRAIVAHTPWAITDREPKALIRDRRDELPELWTERDFLDLFGDIVRVRVDLEAFKQHVWGWRTSAEGRTLMNELNGDAVTKPRRDLRVRRTED